MYGIEFLATVKLAPDTFFYNDIIEFIRPHLNFEHSEMWYKSIETCVETYKTLLEAGYSKDVARDCLPLSLATEIVMTANFREWRHFLKLRLSKRAHYQIREIANLIFNELTTLYPIIFPDSLKEG